MQYHGVLKNTVIKAMKTMFLNMANKNKKEIDLSQASSRINNEY